MAHLGGFDASQVDPTNNFAPVPDGDYPVVITESEFKDTKNGRGQYLQLVLEVIDGPMKGRKIWDRLNLINDNKTAVEIAQKALSQICHAVGPLQPQDSSELHGKPLKATVVVSESPGYAPSNDVKEYGKLDAEPAPAPQAATAQAEPTAPPTPPAAPVAASPQVSGSPWAR
jgi:hypothetical protein